MPETEVDRVTKPMGTVTWEDEDRLKCGLGNQGDGESRLAAAPGAGAEK